MALSDALKKRPQLSSSVLPQLRKALLGKDHSLGLLALHLLDFLLKNVALFYREVAQKDFFLPLMKVLPKRIRNPKGTFLFASSSSSAAFSAPEEDIRAMERFDRILSLLQSLAQTFGPEEAPLFFFTYRKYQERGVRFPAATAEEKAPIRTPPVNRRVLEEREERERQRRKEKEKEEKQKKKKK